MIPRLLVRHLKGKMEKAKIRLEENKLVNGFTGTSLPEAFGRKYPIGDFRMQRNLTTSFGVRYSMFKK